MDEDEDEQQQQQQQQLPLTWNEARSRLRHTLEGWNSERKRQRNNGGGGADITKNNNDDINGDRGPCSSCPVDDPDMMLLAIPLSFLFVLLSFTLPSSDSDGWINSSTSTSFYGRRQLQAAALLFLISSTTSAWITRRRRKVSRETDRSIERRRCVSAFLDGMKTITSRSLQQRTSGDDGDGVQQQQNPLEYQDMYNMDTIPRKNVEDMYSAYRLVDQIIERSGDDSNNNAPDDDDSGRGHWHRIPSLLLVTGDFIALKVGDTAPAKCKAVKNSDKNDDTSDDTSDDDDATNNDIEAGERLTINSLSPLVQNTLALKSKMLSTKQPSTASIASASTVPTTNVTPKRNNAAASKDNKKTSSSSSPKLLPPGRSTLKYHSDEMLLLANGVRIFVLLETPLDSFLRKEDSTEKHNSTPQVLRQGEAVRKTLLPCAIIVFVGTLFVLLVRPGMAQSFFRTPNAYWTLPLLASLGILPVMSPLLLFWIECMGTSRILATVHPLASIQKTQQQQSMEPPKGMAAEDSTRRQYSILSMDDNRSSSENGRIKKPSRWLLCRYLMATASSRLFTKSLLKKISAMRSKAKDKSSSLSSSSRGEALLSIPPASLHLLEKLGVVTAFTLVDDELACEPFSTPQQLLIPSGQGGFSLLDICPVFDGEDGYCSTDDEGINNNPYANNEPTNNNPQQSVDVSIDSDDDSNEETAVHFNHSFSAPARTLRNIRRNYGRKKKRVVSFQRDGSGGSVRGPCSGFDDDDVEVQFEDPQWWKHLPSLKCIGLGCLLVEERTKRTGRARRKMARATTPSGGNTRSAQNTPSQKVTFDNGKSLSSSSRSNNNGAKPSTCPLTPAETSLIDHICHDERERKQLRLLAQCIGFDTSPGSRGDLSCFHERRRLHIVSTDLLRQRIQLNSHALGLEESRNWSRLFTDADTVFVRDARSGGDLVLTVGDSRVVTQLCPDWWQGENSTISPLTAADRHIINETQKNWMLSDMDVQGHCFPTLF